MDVLFTRNIILIFKKILYFPCSFSNDISCLMFLLTCVYHLVFIVINRLREEVVKINKAAGDEKLH